MQNMLHTYFLMFINPVSGGGVGRQYLSVKNKKVKLKSAKGQTTIYVYDLFCEEDRKKGYKKAKQISQTGQVYIVICGGDGTILWVIGEVLKNQVNHNNIYFTVIPIGTGNDFSRSLKWGTDPIKFSEGNTKQLKERVKRWKISEKKKFDLWDIQLSTIENGNIILANEQQQVKRTKYTRTFCNYVGLGIDARVSYGFQKKRVRNKLLNLMIYGCLGFCNLFKKTPKIDEVVSQISESDSQFEGQPEDLDLSIKSDRRNVSLLKSEKKCDKKYKIKRKSKGLVCLNCTSYMAGVNNVWKVNRGSNEQVQDKFQQAFDDGKLQFVSFKNQLSLGLQRFINVCSKVGQGQGPFWIEFKDPEKMIKNYIHIDGEAMVTNGLKSIIIKKTQIVPGGQINVLYNPL